MIARVRWYAKTVLLTHVEIDPVSNASCMGLFTAGVRVGGGDSGEPVREETMYYTQMEAEGFRRFTPFFDRPDVLSRYTVHLE